MFFLLDSELSNFLLKICLDSLGFFELVLHMTESLCATHCVYLFLQRQNLFLLAFNLLIYACKFILLQFYLIGWILRFTMGESTLFNRTWRLRLPRSLLFAHILELLVAGFL